MGDTGQRDKKRVTTKIVNRDIKRLLPNSPFISCNIGPSFMHKWGKGRRPFSLSSTLPLRALVLRKGLFPNRIYPPDSPRLGRPYFHSLFIPHTLDERPSPLLRTASLDLSWTQTTPWIQYTDIIIHCIYIT